MVTLQFIRLPVTISILELLRVLLEEFRRRNLDLNLALASTRTRERVQAVAAAKGGWPLCDPVVRLAGAAYGGSKETSTTVCGDEGRCVVCNLRKAGCSRIAYCCTTVFGEDRQVCCVRFAEIRLFAIC